jgi:hypothetical protein
MPRVPWHTFKDRHPLAHLVAASVPAAQLVGSPDLKAAQAILDRFVRKLAPAGDYATAIVREAGLPEVHFAFAEERDARALADPMHARVSHRHGGWASERAFEFDVEAMTAMASGLPPPRKHGPASR